MKGLLMKDLCNLRQIGKQTLLVLAVLAAWCAFLKNAQIFSMMMIIYTMMLLFTSISYDEMANFDKYALTLPVTRRDLVRTKYLLLLILFAAGILIGAAGGLVFHLILRDGAVFWEEAVSLVSVAFLYLLAFAVLLPVIFRFGVEKARLFLALIFLAAFGLLYAGVMAAKAAGTEITEQMLTAAAAGGIVLALAGLYASYRISVRIVGKKEW